MDMGMNLERRFCRRLSLLRRNLGIRDTGERQRAGREEAKGVLLQGLDYSTMCNPNAPFSVHIPSMAPLTIDVMNGFARGPPSLLNENVLVRSILDPRLVLKMGANVLPALILARFSLKLKPN